ncbi:IS66 family insertion sequence element accessory protein TnpA [Pseudoalteromonas piscicida]|uniref:IS66 family insertion sequence element accessory protein TnpA n=1 Tax=Pseudoalteromonas piscicida TaxID=43662 RepID=UPI003CE52468
MNIPKHKIAEQWLQLIEQQELSGLSVSDFCTQHNLSTKYFYNRRSKLRNKKPPESSFIAAKLDNAVAENFFGILKTEIYHVYEYKSVIELVNTIKEYLEYYNHKRIKRLPRPESDSVSKSGLGSRLEMSPTVWGHFIT